MSDHKDVQNAKKIKKRVLNLYKLVASLRNSNDIDAKDEIDLHQIEQILSQILARYKYVYTDEEN